MTYVKRLVMHGFKSFVKKTELPFSTGINTILGPNGSGKSNISDALCFVLGRLSAKSMRAAKAKNLIFLGSKAVSPAKEAMVEIVFDNQERDFSLDAKEISIKRIVRKNGQSIYKINGTTETRQEVISLLAQAGIDPNGFNIILQGEIQNFVRMRSEDRRKVIEEVSGISIYELRKEKSLKELDKTEEKLKETIAILRERTAYLKNLEREREQALKFKKLEKDVKKYKASIIYSDLTKKKKISLKINEDIEKREREIEKVRKNISSINILIKTFEEKIRGINSTIQKSTGLEQEKLNKEIADIRAELAGMNVKIENHETRLNEVSKQKRILKENLIEGEILLKDLVKESPTMARKQKEVGEKKKELEKLEELRKKFYMGKSELKSIRERLQDKLTLKNNYQNESEFILKQIEVSSKEIFDKKTTSEKINQLKINLDSKKEEILKINISEKNLEKIIHTNEYEIGKLQRLVDNISKMDNCPVCKNKITSEHISYIGKENSPKIISLKEEIKKANKKLIEGEERKEILEKEINKTISEISKRESDMRILSEINLNNRKIKELYSNLEKLKNEISMFEKRKNFLENTLDENTNIEQKYETIKMEIQEISLRTTENISSEISFKQKELERSKITLKQLERDEVELTEEVEELKKILEESEELLEKKKEQEEILNRKFKRLIEERDSNQKKIRDNEAIKIMKQNKVQNIESEINNLKIEKARSDAEVENLEVEMLSFQEAEIIKTNKESLIHKLEKTQEILSNIGSVNLRSLEVYDSIKQEYDVISEKVDIISKEKGGILKIIHEIDIKKKKTFMNTLGELNEIFSRNFSQLSVKGQVYLDLENKKEPFEGGVTVVVKMGHGKYFDVTSLSGGEQTLVALSLIFAIQELKPYSFYVLDEIDAALDKRNSERLGALLKKYMTQGQYIVITHNDEIITNSTNLYGVSMHEGVSKVISLKL